MEQDDYYDLKIILWLILLIVFGITIITCKRESPGVAPDDSLSHEHRNLITAAGLTHLKTGMVIDSHTNPDNPADAFVLRIRKL